MGHLNRHADRGDFPRHCAGYLGLLAENKKGVNRIIDGLPQEKKDFIKTTYAAMSAVNHADTPQNNDAFPLHKTVAR
jgi:hypothetical protein